MVFITLVKRIKYNQKDHKQKNQQKVVQCSINTSIILDFSILSQADHFSSNHIVVNLAYKSPWNRPDQPDWKANDPHHYHKMKNKKSTIIFIFKVLKSIDLNPK